MSYVSEVTADSPTHWWRLNEGSGNLIDSVGSWDISVGSRTYSVASLVPTQADTCVSMSASPNYGTVNTTIPSTLTIEFWIKPTTGTMTNNGICGSWNGSAQGAMFAFVGGNNELRFYTEGTSLVGPTLTNGTTYYIVGTFDGTDRRIYVDGALTHGPTAGTTPTASPGIPWNISGYQSGFGGMFAEIDEVALYTGALSSGRIAAHYAAGTAAAVGRSFSVIVG